MSKQVATLHDAVALLNEAVKLDYNAMSALCGRYVDCNAAMAEHATIQVGERGQGFILGVVGLLNGILTRHSNEDGYIGVRLDAAGALIDFVVVPRADSTIAPAQA